MHCMQQELVQKGQFTQCIQQIWVVGAITYSAKRSTPHTVDAVNAVGVGAKKVNSHSVLSKYGWWGPLPLVQKGQPMQWSDQWMQWSCSECSGHAVNAVVMQWMQWSCSGCSE